MLSKLPLDLSTFSILRSENYVYIDKTEYAYKLITEGRRYFLSRPRRFGKSLFVSTLKEILSGHRVLFEDLWINASDFQWQPHAVISLDFAALSAQSSEKFEVSLIDAMLDHAKFYNVFVDASSGLINIVFKNLVVALSQKYKRVALLIDEYDAPLLRNLHEIENAHAIRSLMQLFFAIIKAQDALIDFVFITGVSSFTKAGLFSGLNNLRAITLDARYTGICGYTDTELDHYLQKHIEAWAIERDEPYEQLREHIRSYYNGYRFAMNTPTLYSPFSVMNALEVRKFNNFWFQSATPSFLVEELKKEYRKEQFHVFNPETFLTSEDALGIFDIGDIPLPTLMYQTGYLTLTDYDPNQNIYKLGYPNFETEAALQRYLLQIFAQIDDYVATKLSAQLLSALNSIDVSKIVSTLRQLFVHVPYSLHGDREKDYHALLHIAFSVAGVPTESEQQTNLGRIDLVLNLPNAFYIIEVKYNKPVQDALDQIKQRKYYEKFLNKGKPVILLGLAFIRAENSFEIEFLTDTLNG